MTVATTGFRRRVRRIKWWPLLGSGVLACSGDSMTAQSDPVIMTSGDTTVFWGGDYPAVPQGTLVPHLVLGSVDGGEAETFGRVRSATQDELGRLYVLDAQTQRVSVFDSTGAFVTAFGGRGGGPGEFSAADVVVAAPDGAILVGEGSRGAIHRFTSEWRYAESVRLGAPIEPVLHHDTTGGLYVRFTGAVPLRSRGASFWVAAVDSVVDAAGTVRLRLDHTVRDTLPPPPVASLDSYLESGGRSRLYVGHAFSPYAWWSWTRAGEFITGRSDRYALDIRVGAGPDGADATRYRSLRRGLSPRDLPAPVATAIQEHRRLLSREGGGASWVERNPTPERVPFYRRVHIGEAGRIWLRTDFPDSPAPSDLALELKWTPTEAAAYDVWDPSGPFLGSVRGPPQLEITWARADTVVALTRGPSEIGTVTRFVIEWQ